MDKAKQARLRKIYKAQAEMSQGVREPVLKSELIKGGQMGMITDSNGEQLGYGLIFPRKSTTADIKHMDNVGLGMTQPTKKLSKYNMFVRDNEKMVRENLAGQGLIGGVLNQATLSVLGDLWQQQKKKMTK